MNNSPNSFDEHAGLAKAFAVMLFLIVVFVFAGISIQKSFTEGNQKYIHHPVVKQPVNIQHRSDYATFPRVVKEYDHKALLEYMFFGGKYEKCLPLYVEWRKKTIAENSVRTEEKEVSVFEPSYGKLHIDTPLYDANTKQLVGIIQDIDWGYVDVFLDPSCTLYGKWKPKPKRFERSYIKANMLVVSKKYVLQNIPDESLKANLEFEIDTSFPTIIGASKEVLITAFTERNWRRSYNYEASVDYKALKFENDSLIVVISFNDHDRAEGVSFLSQHIGGEDGYSSYVNLHYIELFYWANRVKRIIYSHNVTTKYPVELHIGKVH